MSAQVAGVLRKALAAFGPNGENWVRGHGGLGNKCCSVTAFMRSGSPLYVGHSDEGYQILCRVTGAKIGFLGDWNDKQTWPQIKAAYEKAIQLAEAA